MFSKVLIANRGAIACRVIRTLKKLGIASVAVYSEADANSLHVALADEAVCIGPAPAADSYLRADKILAAALQTGAQGIHPGYGFLSENPDFSDACAAAGIAFIGPTKAQMLAFGLKHTARELAEEAGVPLLPGSGLLADVGHARAEAARIGYPVMLKSTAGGGGIGMRLIWSADELGEAYASVDRLARANFKEAGIYLEKYVEAARHIEVQVFGDGAGRVLALGERDCSVQRRNQKVIEETPAPGLSTEQRASLAATAVRLMESVAYRSAGTVEFVMDANSGAFYFLEVNTRLQVEHGVTEEVTGVDLVEWMVRLASGDLELPAAAPAPQGASIQVRLYAEDPAKSFQPSSGLLSEIAFPDGVRVETAVATGSEVPPYYDPMVAKIIVHADSREAATDKLIAALDATRVHGIETNLAYLRQILDGEVFRAGRQTTRYLNAFHYRPNTIDVLESGVQTSVQDWPGRVGYWDVGVPPSGPMDDLALRAANRLVGNPEGAAGLECTMSGPSLRFNCDVVFALTGASTAATLDDQPLAFWQAHVAKAGSVLRIGAVSDAGCRSYLAIAGGFDVPDYLGSKSTFTLGQFGGHAGRTLRLGDVLHVTPCSELPAASPAYAAPDYGHHWEVAVMYGPHGAPDFFTDPDIATFFATDWEIHYNSSRTGVRLIGPKPQWARSDGGEAGLHPSNIHDNAYAIGAIDFTGDMPVILGPDGPSLGGFVCPAVVIQADLWKLGQLRPGDTLRFVPVSAASAAQRLRNADLALRTPGAALAAPLVAETDSVTTPVLADLPAAGDRPRVVYRQAGDAYLLVEYGPLVLDIELRFRVQALINWLHEHPQPGIIDLTPGIRSLQLHFDARRTDRAALLAALVAAEDLLPAVDDMEVPSRTVYLPLSWDDPATKLAIEKYMQSVRKDAPWCPSNIEFIRRINGLDSVEQVVQHGVRGELSGARPGRRLSRRAGRDAGRSAASPGHHQVQPGAHLDAGKRGRHRRRLHVRLWHGRPRRLPVRRAHRADVEPLAEDQGVQQAVAAALFRPGAFRAGERGRAAATAQGFRRRARFAAHRGRHVPARRLPAFPGRQRGADRRIQGEAAGGFRGRARALEGGRPGRLHQRGRHRRGGAGFRTRPAAGGAPGRQRGAGQCLEGAGRARPAGQGRRDAGHRRVDEDGVFHPRTGRR